MIPEIAILGSIVVLIGILFFPYYRVKRWFGYNTVETYENEYDLKRWTVHHLNGKTSQVVGEFSSKNNGFMDFERIDGCQYLSLNPFVWATYKHHRTLEGIQEVEREVVGTTKLTMKRDKADRHVVHTDVTRYDEEGNKIWAIVSVNVNE